MYASRRSARAQAQTIEQQLERLQAHCQRQNWVWNEEDIFRDDGYSGSHLKRPGLDRLRDQAAQAAFDRVLITAPDRLARKYVHQVLLRTLRLPGRVLGTSHEPGPARSTVVADPWGRGRV